MRRDQISKRAERRSQYTNETYTQARSLLSPNQPPIPAAECGKQRNFEAELFHEVIDSHSDFTEFAFGIRCVRPHLDTIELIVESDRRAGRLLNRILPSYEPDGEVHGMPGLRIRRRSERGIEVHIAGRRASAWLTGVSATVWKRHELSALEHLADMGWKPLWRGMQGWAGEELAFEQRWNTGAWARNFQAGAWCGSGLLRRLGLFHTITPADAVTGYKGLGINGYEGMGPVRWCLDVIHRSGVPYRKERLVAALTDTEFGLPVAPARHLDAIYPPDGMENWIRLDDEARTGLIELRFQTFNYPSLQLDSCEPEYREIAEGVERRIRSWPESDDIR
ncbi:hypothetical protein OG497_39300 [Streptomyces sp. NBC_01242]|uniref:hypothetical protein n=1 Tax=Streptomyces sp. NBC_01242 TaxID=2903795 RepID=UPI00225310BB|nr:hypothetical protein [Streptomyces sp. NBC_01242]MCX4799890.1 hypothetical protein [Streptomyces sp. NBC_01242]